MHYTITVDLPRPITNAQAAEVMDAVSDYDSASFVHDPEGKAPYLVKTIEFEGSVGYPVGLSSRITQARAALGWLKGLRFTAVLVD